MEDSIRRLLDQTGHGYKQLKVNRNKPREDEEILKQTVQSSIQQLKGIKLPIYDIIEGDNQIQFLNQMIKFVQDRDEEMFTWRQFYNEKTERLKSDEIEKALGYIIKMEGTYQKKVDVLNKLLQRNRETIKIFLQLMLKFEPHFKMNYKRKAVLLYFFLKMGAGLINKNHPIFKIENTSNASKVIIQVNPYLLPKIIQYIPEPNNYIRHYYIKNQNN